MTWPIEEISDDDELYRRLARNHIKPDGTVSKTAFMRNSDPEGRRKEPDPDISVDLARLTTPQQSLAVAKRPTQGIGVLQAALPRSLGLRVVHVPDVDTGNRAHSSILGNRGDRALENCQALAEALSQNILIRPQ